MKKRTIALVTWLGKGNYGTILQSYALYRKLEDLGYEVFFLIFFSFKSGLKSTVKYLLYLLGILRLKRKCLYFVTPKLRKVYNFQKDYYRTKEVYTKKQYERLLSETDIFITGSDQIWNTRYFFNPFYFLDFARNRKRIAYASSLGSPFIPKLYISSVKSLLSDFAYIGVREESAVNALSDLLNRDDIQQVLDPTFLLLPYDWKLLSESANIDFSLPKKYILCYLIGNNEFYFNQLKDIKEKSKIYDIIIIPAEENSEFSFMDAKIYKDAGPKEFVYLIKHATLVCTDSFHATAISINLSIDFVELLRFSDEDLNSQNSRIYDLLGHYHLAYKFYLKESDKWRNPINYIKVQTILDNDRKSSLKYLTNAIEK